MESLKSKVIQDIERDLLVFKDYIASGAGRLKEDELCSKWRDLIRQEPKRFINPDFSIKAKELEAFRKNLIFLWDEPSFDAYKLTFKNLFGGGRKGSRRLLRDSLDVLKEYACDDLLKKYPSSPVGDPFVFKYKGYEYTYRWTKHIYSLWLFKKILGNKINDDFVAMDIGSSYGIFSYMLKQEFKNSHLVLLDFPEQLVLAHYFLRMNFPDASIAGFKEVMGLDAIGRDFFEKYDFILLPWFSYKKVMKKSVDLITNFASFGEMTRDWLEYYIKNEPFLSAKYLFMENRFQSAPTYDTDITILDYSLGEFKKLHFGICPVFSHTYFRKFLFFYSKLIFSSQHFDFIGERKDI